MLMIIAGSTQWFLENPIYKEKALLTICLSVQCCSLFYFGKPLGNIFCNYIYAYSPRYSLKNNKMPLTKSHAQKC